MEHALLQLELASAELDFERLYLEHVLLQLELASAKLEIDVISGKVGL